MVALNDTGAVVLTYMYGCRTESRDRSGTEKNGEEHGLDQDAQKKLKIRQRSLWILSAGFSFVVALCLLFSGTPASDPADLPADAGGRIDMAALTAFNPEIQYMSSRQAPVSTPIPLPVVEVEVDGEGTLIASTASTTDEQPAVVVATDDLTVLSKLLYGEARGVESEAQKAAICWCVLNRVDNEAFPNSVYEVVTQPSQFEGYADNNPVQSNLKWLASDVLARYKQEKLGYHNIGRTLPSDYYYFRGDGEVNEFSRTITFDTIWNWTADDPYPSLRSAKMRTYTPTAADVEMIAKVIWGAARGVDNEMQQAAVAWCIMNRVESHLFPDTVAEVIQEFKQFPAYHDANPVVSNFKDLAKDVVDRWKSEMRGAKEADVLRVLPKEYIYFNGRNRINYFSKTYPVRHGYNFNCKNPYAALRKEFLKTYEPTTEEYKMLAKYLYGTSIDHSSTMKEAALIWLVFNRVASPMYPDSVKGVLTEDDYLEGYRETYHVESFYMDLAKDVYERWHDEMNGAKDVGRVLPSNYFFVYRYGGENHFFPRYKSKEWTWTLPDPY